MWNFRFYSHNSSFIHGGLDSGRVCMRRWSWGMKITSFSSSSYHNQYFKLVSDNNNILVGVGQVNYDPYYTYAGINLGFFTWRRIYSWVYALLWAHKNYKLTGFDMESTDEMFFNLWNIFQWMKYFSTVACKMCVTLDVDVKSLQIVCHLHLILVIL